VKRPHPGRKSAKRQQHRAALCETTLEPLGELFIERRQDVRVPVHRHGRIGVTEALRAPERWPSGQPDPMGAPGAGRGVSGRRAEMAAGRPSTARRRKWCSCSRIAAGTSIAVSPATRETAGPAFDLRAKGPPLDGPYHRGGRGRTAPDFCHRPVRAPTKARPRESPPPRPMPSTSSSPLAPGAIGSEPHGGYPGEPRTDRPGPQSETKAAPPRIQPL
jgi:hypothetical protein